MARKVMKQEIGTIYQKPSGTYYYRYQINGERKAISLKTRHARILFLPQAMQVISPKA